GHSRRHPRRCGGKCEKLHRPVSCPVCQSADRRRGQLPSRRTVRTAGAAVCAGAARGAGGAQSGCGKAKKPHAGPGTTLGPSDEVQVGSARIYTDANIVVSRPDRDELVGFSAVCTHAGCIVGEVMEDTITCPCHGSAFSIDDGSVVNGPATEPLPRVEVVDENGTLRVSDQDPA